MTPSQTPSATPAETPSATPSPSASPAGSGRLIVVEAVSAPNPTTDGRIRMSVQLEGPADALRYGLYSTNWVKVLAGSHAGPLGAGWHSFGVDAEALPNGAYYMVVWADRDDGVVSPRKVVKLFLLR
jgi:hypothetical protein